MIQLHKNAVWKISYDMFKSDERLGTLYFYVGINITIDDGVATFEPTTTGSNIYQAGRVVPLTSLDQVMWRHTIISPKDLHDVEAPFSFDRLDLDPWKDRGAFEDHLRDSLNRFGINLTNRQPHDRGDVSRADFMRFLQVVPHYLILASTLNYKMKLGLWFDTPHDMSSLFWDGLGKPSLRALATWRGDHPNTYRLLLAALSGIKVIRCSWDAEAGL